MKFQVLSLISHSPHPLTGELLSPADRFEEVLAVGEAAERLGFDAYSIGERHAGAFLSSSPTAVLGALAAQSITVDAFGLDRAEQIETLQRFAEEIAPIVRKEAPTTLWDA
jgi:luciferase-like monooxygenase